MHQPFIFVYLGQLLCPVDSHIIQVGREVLFTSMLLGDFCIYICHNNDNNLRQSRKQPVQNIGPILTDQAAQECAERGSSNFVIERCKHISYTTQARHKTAVFV